MYFQWQRTKEQKCVFNFCFCQRKLFLAVRLFSFLRKGQFSVHWFYYVLTSLLEETRTFEAQMSLWQIPILWRCSIAFITSNITHRKSKLIDCPQISVLSPKTSSNVVLETKLKHMNLKKRNKDNKNVFVETKVSLLPSGHFLKMYLCC